MKNIISVAVALIMLLLGCQSKSVESLQPDIDRISKRWVPDKRIGICSLSVVCGRGTKPVLKGESMFAGATAEALQLFRSKGISIIDSVVILPDTTLLEKSWGLITLSISNIRSKPAHSSEMVSQAIMGTPVRILKDVDGWILIQTPDRYIGWTNKSAVQSMSWSEISNWRKADRMIYTESEGKIFADEENTIFLSDLVAGAIVNRGLRNKNLIQVNLPDGRVGYVSGLNWVDFNQWKDTVALNSERMIVSGKQLMGFPYLWGGTSSKGMDCSGFVKTVCFLNGVILERDASQQIHHGAEVDLTSGLDKLKKGDLLFFGSKQPFRVTHVGIYIGDSEVIHESGTAGSVHINSLDKNSIIFRKDLSTNLVGARRIIGISPEPGYWPVSLHNWY